MAMASTIGQRIVSKVHSGLGNQMFQYAAGRALAIRSGSELELDLRHFDNQSSMGYALHHFDIQVAGEPGVLPPLRKKHRLQYLLWRWLRRSPKLIKEKGLAFDRRLLAPMSNVYLDGYWQSERYFSEFATTIRKDFQFKTPPNPDNANNLREITSCASVSVHVRRGDYLKPKNLELHGTCSPEFYSRAVDLIATRIGAKPVIYVFSDDPDWVEDNLVLPFERRIIKGNGPDDAYEDLRLMSSCRHHVIANSSFSWWGAWLNPSPDKIVVAPKRWFADPSYHNPDLVPQAWHRLDN